MDMGVWGSGKMHEMQLQIMIEKETGDSSQKINVKGEVNMKCKCLVVSGVILVFLLTFFGGSVHAVDKTGFVNLREVINKSNAGKKLAEDLKKSMEKDRAALIEKDKDLKKLKEEIDAQVSKLKQNEIKEKKTIFEKKLEVFKDTVNEFNSRFRQKEQEIVVKLMPEILKTVATIAKKGKYTMIVDPQISQIAYFSPRSDLTKWVLREFNKSYKGE